ncbi:MAG: DUF4153 domain-containing protein [Rhodospirillales bacterium]|nr:DUF4153 domain-containing protein [Rhodospirillales bacterium]
MIILTIVALAYALGYTVCVLLKREAWPVGVARVNPIIAIAVVILAIGIHLPPLEAFTVSAQDQLRRLRLGKVEIGQFDFAYLKFELGAPGRQALAEIQNDPQLMANRDIANGLAHLSGLSRYALPKFDQSRPEFSESSLRDIASYMDLFPSDPDHQVDISRLDLKTNNFLFLNCRTAAMNKNPRCAFLSVDINNDGRTDAALLHLGMGLKTWLQQNDGSWIAGPDLQADNATTALKHRAEMNAAINRGEIQLQPHALQDVVIDGIRFQ